MTPRYTAYDGYPDNQWWVAAHADEVADKPLGRTLLEQAVVIFRPKPGEIAVLEDRCPHRQIPLSLGVRVGEALQCSYHGLRFGADGRCLFAPGLPTPPDVLNVRSYPAAERLDGCVIYRFDAPLFFANTRTFREQVRGLSLSSPTPRWIIIAAEPITDVDTTAADMLHDLDVTLNADGVSLVFAEMKDPVRRKVDRYELTRTIDPSHFFPTLDAAVAAFQEQSGAQWREPAPERAS